MIARVLSQILGAPFMNDPAHHNSCILCGLPEACQQGSLGALLGPISGKQLPRNACVHRLCCLWSPEVHYPRALPAIPWALHL